MNRLFWEIVDEAQQTRSRLRLRRELSLLARREAGQYQRLGQMGADLLQDGVSVTRTPETLLILAEIDRLQEEQRRLQSAQTKPPSPHFPWRRIEDALRAGEWVIQGRTLPDSSPWSGRAMTGKPEAGLCLVVKDGPSITVVTPEMVGRGGDYLIVLSPVEQVSDWEQWIASGPGAGFEGSGERDSRH